MGTRADFYMGRGPEARWLGSIAWDGYPSGIDEAVLCAAVPELYEANVNGFLKGRGDATLPADGWPWPWKNSATTDYAYAFDGGKVYASCFGREWFDPLLDNGGDDENAPPRPKTAVFPDMSEFQNTTFGPRSGLIVVTG